MLRRKGIYLIFALIFMVSVVLGGCGENQPNEEDNEVKDDLRVVATISILGDIAENIVRDRGDVDYLVPVGDNPEDYEFIPSDFEKVNNADVMFINGWGLEETIVRSAQSIGDVKLVYVTDGITPLPLVGEAGNDPHAWFDPKLTITYVKNMLDTIIKLDPEGETEYRQNADDYIAELKELDAWISEEVKAIPEENRVLVISENALKYFGEAYGFQTEGIWELNAHEEGTIQQISRIVDLVKEQELPAIFVETTLDDRYMERISEQTGVPIAGDIYTDALGLEGSGAETYIDMMEHNVKTYVQGLSEK